jgi:RNA polymerase sigma-70 factor, ECF subfamily
VIEIPSNEDLMLAVGKGDVDAFEQIVLRHQVSAWNIAYRFVGNRHDAEDLVQDAFLRLLNAAPRYRPTASFRTYFSRIISHLCLDHLQKKRPLTLETLPELEDSALLSDRVIVNWERAVAVKKGIASLPPNQRLAVIFRYYEDYSYKEIAVAMETTEKAVERLLARGRETLERTLKDWTSE